MLSSEFCLCPRLPALPGATPFEVGHQMTAAELPFRGASLLYQTPILTIMSRSISPRCPQLLLPRVTRTRHSRAFAAAPSTPRFDWQDPLGSKALLTSDELAISEAAERYCQEQLLPRVLRMSSPGKRRTLN